MEQYSKEERRTILTYCIELGVIAAVFLVMGFLEVFSVIKHSDKFINVIKWVITFGGAIITSIAIYSLLNPNRRNKVSILDKSFQIPQGLYAMILGICYLCNIQFFYDNRQYFIGAFFFFNAVVYVIQCFYHYKKPLPGLLDEAVKEETKESDKKEE